MKNNLLLSLVLLLTSCTIQFGDDAEDAIKVEEVVDTGEITTAEAFTWWENWDDDVEGDGIEVNVYFEDESQRSVFNEARDWEVEVKLYNAEYTEEFDFAKTDEIYSHYFTVDEVKYDSAGDPFVRIPKEELGGATVDYGWAEMTYISPTLGTFADYDDYSQLRE